MKWSDGHYNAIKNDPMTNPNTNPPTLTWAYKKKPHLYKARTVARGFLQDLGDSGDVHSPVARPQTARTLLAWSAAQGRSVLQGDVEGAYTKSEITGPPVYVTPPSKDYAKDGHVLQLCRSLYGLRSSGKAWYLTLCKYLCSQGLKPTAADPCLFTNPDKSLVVAFYVDDLIVSSSTPELGHRFLSNMNNMKTGDS